MHKVSDGIHHFISLFFLWLKVTASVEQSYSYYSGNDGTDKDPQVSYTIV